MSDTPLLDWLRNERDTANRRANQAAASHAMSVYTRQQARADAFTDVLEHLGAPS